MWASRRSFPVFPIPTTTLARVYSAAVHGVDAFEVEIEVNAGAGNPSIVIVEPIFALR